MSSFDRVVVESPPNRKLLLGYCRVGDHADRTPDESDMRKGGLAGQLIFSDALPAEIMRAG
jgi:hypothetical protein